jgi:hypothetical protein
MDRVNRSGKFDGNFEGFTGRLSSLAVYLFIGQKVTKPYRVHFPSLQGRMVH